MIESQQQLRIQLAIPVIRSSEQKSFSLTCGDNVVQASSSIFIALQTNKAIAMIWANTHLLIACSSKRNPFDHNFLLFSFISKLSSLVLQHTSSSNKRRVERAWEQARWDLANLKSCCIKVFQALETYLNRMRDLAGFHVRTSNTTSIFHNCIVLKEVKQSLAGPQFVFI